MEHSNEGVVQVSRRQWCGRRTVRHWW